MSEVLEGILEKLSVEQIAKVILRPETPIERVLHEVLELLVYGGIGYVIRGQIEGDKEEWQE